MLTKEERKKAAQQLCKNLNSTGVIPQFQDLQFKTREEGKPEQAIVEFPNGYIASIVRGPDAFGGDKGLLEIGIYKQGKSGRKTMQYKTGLTSTEADTEGVIPNLAPEEVTETLRKIAELK